MWALVGACAALALLVGGAVAIVLGSAGGAAGVRGAAALTLPAPGASSSGEPASSGSGGGGFAGATGAGSSSGEAGAGGAPGHGATAPGSATAPSAPVDYRGSRFTARIPAGWTTQEDEAPKEGYVESKWLDGASPGDTVLIDESPAPHVPLQQSAAPVHEALVKEAGYQELYYGVGDLEGVESWKWVFRVSGDQRVDYFFEKCDGGFAVLGSTAPERFARLSATFRGVAQSVQSTCR